MPANLKPTSHPEWLQRIWRQKIMMDHIGVNVMDFARSKAFYEKALAPLSIALLKEISAAQSGANAHAGFGSDGKPFFWIGTGIRASGPLHIAFVTPRRSDVEAFHRAAMAAGGTDNGSPGPRPQYHANYFGAFVLDPDGNNVEAVCHNPQ
jgi:catechol 2,3-dioxygenase-like lactoylglutathione lyase family enzyme